MEITQTANPPSFESVWAILQEVGKKQEELVEIQKETARQMKEIEEQRKKTEEQRKKTEEQRKKTEEQRKESEEQRKKEFDRKMEERDKRFDKILGRLGNRLGDIVECMFTPGIVGRFRELGFVFNKAYPNTSITDRVNNIITEVDITLENGDIPLRPRHQKPVPLPLVKYSIYLIFQRVFFCQTVISLFP